MTAAKILVTGGAGFIGSALVERLVEDNIGHDVVIIDNFSTGTVANLADVLRNIEIRKADIRDREAMIKCCKGMQTVFHLAAVASVEQSVRNPLHAYEVNVEGTQTMLMAAQATGVERFIFASSSAVYGDAESLPTPETEKPRPRSPYAEQKLYAESMVRKRVEIGAAIGVSLRFFNVYGPRQNSTSTYSGVLSAFCSAALRGERPAIFGDGYQSRDFIFVDDAVRAIIQVATTGQQLAAVYNVGTSKNYTLNATWDLIQDIAGIRLPARYSLAREGDVRHTQAETTMIEKLGFRAYTDLRSGLLRLISWHRLQDLKSKAEMK